MSKAIVFNEDNRCPYVFDDSVTIAPGLDKLEVRNNGDKNYDIGDMNSLNSTVHQGVTAPDDWKGNRYTFNGVDWTEIEGWVDPTIAEIDRLEAEVTRLKATL